MLRTIMECIGFWWVLFSTAVTILAIYEILKKD